MPTALKTTTAGLTIDEPSIFLIGSTSYETRGGVTVTPTVTMRQIEVDGVSQAIAGLDFVESTAITVSTTLIAAPNTTLAMLMWQDTPTGTLPDQAWQTPEVNKLLPSGALIANVKVLRRRKGDLQWQGISIPSALITSWTPTAGTNGDGGYQITIESRCPASTPYASHWELIVDDAPAGV